MIVDRSFKAGIISRKDEKSISLTTSYSAGSRLPPGGHLDPGLHRGDDGRGARLEDDGQGRPSHEVVWASLQSSVARASAPGDFSFPGGA
jgi:hypothetical protein